MSQACRKLVVCGKVVPCKSVLRENSGSTQFVETKEKEFTMAVAGTEVCFLRFRIEKIV